VVEEGSRRTHAHFRDGTATSGLHITGEQIVPGRREEAVQLNVRVVTQNGNIAEVPFTLVRTRRDSSWLIESFALDALTRAR
jgi:hypothetical protein